MNDIAHTYGVLVFQNALLNRAIDEIIPLQNHRYRSFPELLRSLPAMIFPFHMKPIYPALLYSDVIFLQTDVQFHHVVAQESNEMF
ncbi:hypothetical protein D3C85_1434940 [compost metagenome]